MPEYDPLFLQNLFGISKYDTNLTNSALWVDEIIVFILAAITLYHGIKTYGKFRTALFFSGCFLFAGLEENFWIIAGSLIPPPSSMNTYFFSYNGGAIIWFITVPLKACLAWFFLAYTSFHIAMKIAPNWSILKQAALGSFLAMDLDLMMDPIAVRKVYWQWLTGMPNDPFHFPQLCIFGVPFSNFLGWFLLIFIFDWFWAKHTTEDYILKWGGQKKGSLIYSTFLVIHEILLLFLLLIVTSIVITIIPAGFNVTIGGI